MLLECELSLLLSLLFLTPSVLIFFSQFVESLDRKEKGYIGILQFSLLMVMKVLGVIALLFIVLCVLTG